MTCYSPLKGYRSKLVNPSGKNSITFNPKLGYVDQKIDVPCGKCIGCRLDYSRYWAIRCSHEASLYLYNSFITLTYNDENLPKNKSLVKRDVQLFFKRLRKKFKHQIRYYHCGEYGGKEERPHYHIILFNCDFFDKRLYRVRRGNRLYNSKTLDDCWKLGFAVIGSVTWQSVAYCARYVTKKKYGELAEKVYKDRIPEYTTMSLKPGIGEKWIEKYWKTVYNDDTVIINGRKMRPPPFYDSWLAENQPDVWRQVKAKRASKIDPSNPEFKEKRLLVKMKFKQLQARKLKRSLEDENVNVHDL